MNDSSKLPSRADALDRLTASLLDCGGVVRQIVAGMVRFEADGHATADTMPIPEAARARPQRDGGDRRRLLAS